MKKKLETHSSTNQSTDNLYPIRKLIPGVALSSVNQLIKQWLSRTIARPPSAPGFVVDLSTPASFRASQCITTISIAVPHYHLHRRHHHFATVPSSLCSRQSPMLDVVDVEPLNCCLDLAIAIVNTGTPLQTRWSFAFSFLLHERCGLLFIFFLPPSCDREGGWWEKIRER
ncbi:unnamed protein product [Linum trigynum]|uniref:Uncharacterized protein n=1 Tax=Linum trigynum TaxID=586398 RepID=A0AAV2FRR9_9ROSI